MQKVYLDNAATTPVRDEVIQAMGDVLKNHFGNPSSTHSYGRSSKALLEKSRKAIAAHFNVLASEIVFTSGGTEANNLILTSAVRDLGVRHVITSKIEHHAVLHTLDHLKQHYELEVSFVNLDKKGHVDFAHLEALLKNKKLTLVSLMHVNNEVGNQLDLKTFAQLCKTYGALSHSDTVQSVGHFEIDLQEIPLDFIVASAHKFHGPKGVGFAFIRKGSKLKALIFGGEQERGHRAGTESLHNIVGMETALKIAYLNLVEDHKYIVDLKSYFIEQLTKLFPSIKYNGDCSNLEKSTYTLINVCLPLAAEKTALLQFQLDLKGVACSRGSACQSGSNQGSHVLTQLLDATDLEKPSLRFSLSCFNTKSDVDHAIAVLAGFSSKN